MKRCLLFGFATLSACSAPSYHDKLTQTLEGKSAEQQKRFLAEQCLTEIEASRVANPKMTDLHPKRMAAICEELTGNSADLPPQK